MTARYLIPLIVVGLLLAACGGGSSEKDAEQTQQSTPGGNGTQEVGTDEFGMTEEQLVNAIETGESLIAGCMADAGFEYIAIDVETFRDAMDTQGSVPGLSDEEYVAQYGYGITTLPPTSHFRFGDENQRIFDELSPEDQVAYTRTLSGDNIQATYVNMLEIEDFGAAGGCTETAIREVYSEEQLSPTFFNPFDALVEQDPRMVEAWKNWSACMSEAGFDYETEGDLEDELRERLDALTAGADPDTLTGNDKDALTELQGEERAVAVVANDCLERFVQDVERQVEQDISGR